MNRHTVVLKSVLLCAAACCAGLVRAGDIVVVMAAGAAPLTKDQVAGVFVGRNMDFRPLDLPEANPAHAVFYKAATGRDLAQIKAAWSRIAFTGLGQPPRQLADAKAVKLALAADPKAIGYIDKAEVDSTVAVVLELH